MFVPLNVVLDVAIPIVIGTAFVVAEHIFTTPVNVRPAFVPIFRIPSVWLTPIFKFPVVRFPPILMAIATADESYTGDVIFVPIETLVPFNVVFDVVLPIVIGTAFVVAVAMLICPLAVLPVLFPIYMFPLVWEAPIDNPTVIKLSPIDNAVIADVES